MNPMAALVTNTDFLFAAVLGGIIPSLIWLLYWLREDRRNPEPKKIILFTCIAGAIAVPFVLPFEQFVCNTLWPSCKSQGAVLFQVIIAWAFIEEFFKFAAAYIVALRSKYMDEPVDAVIYMISAALGFAALENTFFIFGPLDAGNVFEGILTGNLRFIGASVLHTVSSAAIGVSIALSYYRKRTIRHEYLLAGLVISVIMHATFNLFILKQAGGNIFTTFSLVWLAALVLLLFFERIKRIHRSPEQIRK